MEGASLPWRTQKIVNNSPDIESFCKSLPPPPVGYKWEVQQDNSWVLVEVEPSRVNSDNIVKVDNPSILEHVIMPNDTLQGICLRYKVTAIELRRVNMFSGNNIKCFKTLKIPLAAGVQFESQMNDPEVLVRRLSNMTNEGMLESRIYLEENNWDVDAAYAKWQQDDNWHLQSLRETVEKSNIVPPAAVVFVDAVPVGVGMHSRRKAAEYEPTPEGDEDMEMLTLVSLN